MRIAALIALSVAPRAHAFECVAPIPAATIDQTLAAAEEAFTVLDEVGFRDRVNEASSVLLPCATTALPRPLVARYHRNMALHRFTNGDEPGAMAALDAARRIEPDFRWSSDLLPPSHPLVERLDAPLDDVKTRKVPEPRAGSIAFDGTVGRKRPRELPALTQVFDEQGRAVTTTYLGPREALPPYRAIPRQRTTLLIGSGAALLTSATLYGLAWSHRSALFRNAEDLSVDAKTLDAQRRRTNALTAGSAFALGLSVGAGAGAALIGER